MLPQELVSLLSVIAQALGPRNPIHIPFYNGVVGNPSPNAGGIFAPIGIHRLCLLPSFQSLTLGSCGCSSAQSTWLYSVVGMPAAFRNGNIVL